MLIPYEDLTIGILVLARMTSMASIMPIFGFTGIPLQLKAGLSIIFTIIVFPLVKMHYEPISYMPLELILLFAHEVLIGLVIGFITTIIFFGIQMAGQIVGIQIGFGIINVIDPLTNIQVSMIGQLYYLVALLIFLAMDGHHFLVRALWFSYETIPLGAGIFSAALVENISRLTGLIYHVALQVAAPVMVSLIITDVGLGFMARVAPQMNVFIVGFPLKIMVGLLVMTLVIQYFPYIFGKLLAQFEQDLILIIRLIGA